MWIQRAPCTLAVLLLLAPGVRSEDGLGAEGAGGAKALPIRLDRPHEVFSSGESVSGNVAVPPEVGPVEQVMLQWRVTPARSGAVLHQGTHTARLTAMADQSPTIPFEIPLPAEEGVYDLQLTLFAGAQSRDASLQVVVVSPLPRPMSPERDRAPRLVDGLSIAEHAGSPETRAARLRIGRAGVPHRVVASFSSADAEPELSIVDAAAHPAIGSPAEVLPAASSAGAADPLQTREFVFWPLNDTPVLLMEHAAKSLRIDVYELSSLSPAAPLARASGQNLPARWMGPHLRSSDLVEHFATGSEGDAPGDWVTLQAAGVRLIEALHASGANSLLLTVGDDQDRDSVEFLYRLFEREGLTLLPELPFSAELPALEGLRASGDPAVRGMELIGRDGRTWREHNPSQRSGPLYNPLHPAVQEAVLAALGTFVERYAPREVFRGVAVRLSARGYLQFPSVDWGYDDETVARFERETKLTVPAGPGESRYQRRYEFLTGPARAQWVRWRATELAAFYRRMADVVTAAKPGARLVLSGRGEFPENGRPAEVFVDYGGDTGRLPGLKPADAPHVRERLAHAVAAADLQMAFSADWIVTRGNDPASWELRRTLQALPAIAFHRHEPVPQPVVIRVGRAGEKTFLYAVNEFPGPVSLEVQLSCAAETPCRPLGLSEATRLVERTASGSMLRLRLEPFGVWAGEITGAAVQITGVNVAVDESARAHLQSRIARFAARVTEIQQAGRPVTDVHSAPLDPKENWTAEPTAIAPGQALVWTWDSTDDGITLTAGREPPEGGPAPLMLVRLVARTDADATPLRLAIESDVSGEVPSGAVPLHARRTPARYSFPCRMLSPQEQVSLRVENRGMAAVWIGAVELRAYRITPDDLRELTKTVSALTLAWEECRYADCHRLLESEWGRLPFDAQAVTSRFAEPVQHAAMPLSQP